MEFKDLLNAIAHVKTTWSLAAFAIAATLGVLRSLLATPAAVKRRGSPAPPVLESSLVWAGVIAICFMGALPILVQAYIKMQEFHFEADKLNHGIYRVRVIVVDPTGNPAVGATLRTTASNETTETQQGIAIISVPKATLPADGKIRVFADLDSAFQHGHTDVELTSDFNPSVTIALDSRRDATITGLVEDDRGRAIGGVTVSVIGGESRETSINGSFELKANVALGQVVRVHAEKVGYKAVDQDQPAGRTPMTIVLAIERPPYAHVP